MRSATNTSPPRLHFAFDSERFDVAILDLEASMDSMALMLESTLW